MMKELEIQSHSNESASPSMTKRSRPWVAAGLAVGLLAGAGVSVAVALPFSAGASTDIAAATAKDYAGTGIQSEHHGGPSDGPGHRHHRGMRSGLRGDLRGELVQSAALILDLMVDQLREQMRRGLTLSEIAEEQGVDRQDLIDALTATAIETMTEKINDRISAIVDGEFGPRKDS